MQHAPLRSCPTALMLMIASTCLSASAAAPHREPFRPQFHFTPAQNWMNDPNGMVFFDGEYHLFYQYNPYGDKWGHMSWGHAVSPDLVHWEHLPVTLLEENQVMIFSGSAVVDWNNTSGFGRGGKPPLVAIYTGHHTDRPLQNQQIAYSTDRGRTWTRYTGNPVLDIGEKDFRDPKVFWHEPTRQWVMTVAWPVHRKVRFYASPNLKDWTHLSDFGPAGSTIGIWECPDLFPLRVTRGGRGEKWVLIVNVGSGAPAGGSGCQYFVGDFDGRQFTADPCSPGNGLALWADFGPDFYAAVSWSDIPRRDGRRLWLGWMSNWRYANDVPTAPWRSAMSLPRELRLHRTDDGLRLAQIPVRELRALRGDRQRFRGGTPEAANAWLADPQRQVRGNTLEIVATFGPALSGRQGLRVLAGPDGATEIGIDRDRGTLSIDRTRSGSVAFHPEFSGTHAAPLPGAAGRPVSLHVFVDAGSVEVFADDGVVVLTSLVLPPEGSRGVSVFSSTGDAEVRSLTVWPLRSAWGPAKRETQSP